MWRERTKIVQRKFFGYGPIVTVDSPENANQGGDKK
jgi:hypothetical protein